MTPDAEAVIHSMLAYWDREEQAFWRALGALRLPPGAGAQAALEAYERERGEAYLRGAFALLDRLLAERVTADPGFRSQVPEVLDEFLHGDCRSVFFGGWKNGVLLKPSHVFSMRTEIE